MKEQVNEVSRSLKAVHRRFLERERIQAEDYFQRRLTPFDFLQVLTTDKNFQWLQPFSALIADIDAFVDDGNEITQSDLKCIKDQVDFVLGKSNPHSAIYNRYHHHLNQDPEFVLLHANLAQSLTKLVPASPAKNP